MPPILLPFMGKLFRLVNAVPKPETRFHHVPTPGTEVTWRSEGLLIGLKQLHRFANSFFIHEAIV